MSENKQLESENKQPESGNKQPEVVSPGSAILMTALLLAVGAFFVWMFTRPPKPRSNTPDNVYMFIQSNQELTILIVVVVSAIYIYRHITKV